jgi:hypothetical protein
LRQPNPDSDAYGDTYGHGVCNADSDCHSHSNSHSHSHSNTDSYGYSDSHADSDRYGNCNGNTDGDGYRYTDANPPAEANTDAQAASASSPTGRVNWNLKAGTREGNSRVPSLRWIGFSEDGVRLTGGGESINR